MTTPAAPERAPAGAPDAALLRGLAALIPPAAFTLAGWLAWGGLLDGGAIGLLGWLALRLGPIRLGLLAAHRRGMAASRDQAWEQALAAFRASEARWRTRPLLDRWRAPLLGSTGPWPYLALAGFNQALCLAELGRRDQALTRLDQLLAEHPGMAPARALRAALEPPVEAAPTAAREGWEALDQALD